MYTQRTSGRYITEDQSMIEQVKTALARERMQQFLEQMEHIGITREQILTWLQAQEEELK